MSESSDIYYYDLIVSYFKDNVNFTKEQFLVAKYKAWVLPFKCSTCGKIYYLSKEWVYKAVKDAKSIKNIKTLKYCNRSCYPNGPITTNCDCCGKQITKPSREYKLSKHHFCSRSCAAKYNNTRRPKRANTTHTPEAKIKHQKTPKLKRISKVKRVKQPKVCIICGQQRCVNKDLCNKLKRLIQSKTLRRMGLDHTLIGTPKILESYYKVRQYVYDLYHNQLLSLSDLMKIFDIKWINSLTSAMDSLEITRRDLRDATVSYYARNKNNYENPTEKDYYYSECQFKFGFSFPNIQGYDLIKQYGIYSSTNNLGGVSRDHIVSISYGWEHKIPPEMISHPANCQIVRHIDNIHKSTRCSITVDELANRIKLWEQGLPLPDVKIALP